MWQDLYKFETNSVRMNWKRTLLYGAFALYQIAAFVFCVMVDGHLDLLALLRYIPLFKYVTLIGLVLMVLDIAWYRKEKLENELNYDALRRERDALRVKLERQEQINKAKETEKV